MREENNNGLGQFQEPQIYVLFDKHTRRIILLGIQFYLKFTFRKDKKKKRERTHGDED